MMTRRSRGKKEEGAISVSTGEKRKTGNRATKEIMRRASVYEENCSLYILRGKKGNKINELDKKIPDEENENE